MGISVSSANAPTLAASQNSLSSVVLKQSAADAKTSTSPMTITAFDPAVAAARLEKYNNALDAPLLMGTDAKDIANALAPTMQSNVSERPDLANAHFDFQSNNGSIQVVSSSLSVSDKTWIQGKLNSNATLVQAVNSFHDHAVAGYATWSDADGSPLTKAQSDAVSKKADGLVGFLNLFQSLGNEAQKFLEKDGIYYTSNGQTMNFAQDPSTAAGFLGFVNSAQAGANGTFSFVSNSRHNFYGGQMNVFNNDSVIPNFFPASPTQSLGLNEVA
jgi:hypothetical protein